jgi:hypothetical protein
MGIQRMVRCWVMLSLWPPHPTDKSASPFSVSDAPVCPLSLSLSAHMQTGLAMSTGYSGPDIICRSVVLPVSASQWFFFWEFLFVAERDDRP